MLRKRFLTFVTMIALSMLLAARSEARLAQNDSLDKIIDSIIEREKQMVESMADFSPIVETYVQNFTADKELGEVPSSDRYFLTKLGSGKEGQAFSMTPRPGFLSRITSSLTQIYNVRYQRMGLVDMILLDPEGFSRENYDFQFVRKEFLGDVRCLVFDLQPKPKAGKNRFSGRIWVEDDGYNIVRFNGIQGRSGMTKLYFHADSWRQNMGSGNWLPVYVYGEESDLDYAPGRKKLNFKAQTRLWGYNIATPQYEDERTTLIVESETVRDGGGESDPSDSPILGLRAWERQAEDNILERMQRAGLLAPEGEMDAVLKTVVTNLEITNDLAFDPPVRARVLLTSPIESFTIGHTIVVSRGLIDVLPDEASLGMVLGHEVAHIALGHRLDTKYAFHDRMLFKDHDTFEKLIVKRTESEERAADEKAIELLRNSPYKDKLGNAGLFLKAVQQRAKQLPSLLQPHMGNRIAGGQEFVRMNALAKEAPQLEMKRVDQIAALPLGGRLRVDPWNASVELVKSKPVALLGVHEKMPFEITPIFPHLTRRTPGELAKTSAIQQ